MKTENEQMEPKKTMDEPRAKRKLLTGNPTIPADKKLITENK